MLVVRVVFDILSLIVGARSLGVEPQMLFGGTDGLEIP